MNDIEWAIQTMKDFLCCSYRSDIEIISSSFELLMIRFMCYFQLIIFFLAKNDAFSELCDCYSESVMYFCGDLNLEQVDIVFFFT